MDSSSFIFVEGVIESCKPCKKIYQIRLTTNYGIGYQDVILFRTELSAHIKRLVSSVMKNANHVYSNRDLTVESQEAYKKEKQEQMERVALLAKKTPLFLKGTYMRAYCVSFKDALSLKQFILETPDLSEEVHVKEWVNDFDKWLNEMTYKHSGKNVSALRHRRKTQTQQTYTTNDDDTPEKDVRLPIEIIARARSQATRLKIQSNREELIQRLQGNEAPTVLNALTFNVLERKDHVSDIFVVMRNVLRRCNIFAQLKKDIEERTRIMLYPDGIIVKPYIADYEIIKLCEYCDDYEHFKEDPYEAYLAKNTHHSSFSSLERYAALNDVAMERRVLGNLVYNMQSMMNNEGHTCVPLGELCDTTKNFMSAFLINDAQIHSFEEIDLVKFLHNVDDRFYLYEQEKNKANEKNEENVTFVYLNYVWKKESYIVERLSDYKDNGLYFKLADGNPGPGEKYREKIIRYIERYEKDAGIPFNVRQKQAIMNCLGTPVGINILTGLPGTGKSRVIACVKDLGASMGKKVLLAAPTGKASQRLGTMACTLHRLLEATYDEGKGNFTFKKNEENPLKGDILIVDESSMVDFTMFYHLLKACPPELSILFVGDPHQLPPVGFGDVFNSLVKSKVYPLVHLNKVYRQGEGSVISMLSKCIVKGLIPSMEFLNDQKETFFIKTKKDDNNGILDKIGQLYEKYGNQAVILSPMRKGPLGTTNINGKMHYKNLGLNSIPDIMTSSDDLNGNLDGFYRKSERVMVSQNTYVKDRENKLDMNKSAFNGDMGYFYESSIDKEGQNQITVFIEEGGFAKDGEKKVREVKMERDAIDLGHACTVHKMQGGEIPVVILVMNSYHWRMLHNRLFYTAVTRAKQKLYIIGDESAIIRAVETPSPERYELINERIQSHEMNSI